MLASEVFLEKKEEGGFRIKDKDHPRKLICFQNTSKTKKAASLLRTLTTKKKKAGFLLVCLCVTNVSPAAGCLKESWFCDYLLLN